MSWGQVGREHEEEPTPATSSFRWVAVGALCLAVVLFVVAFVAVERRAASPSSAAAVVSSPAARTPSPDASTASAPPSPQPSPATATGGGAPVDRQLFDFSGGGTQGWEYGTWQEGDPGRVEPAPPPVRGVTVVSPTDGGWFRAPFPAPADLTGATTLSYDVDGGGTDVIVAMTVGPQEAWCETKGGRTPPGASTVDVELASILDGCLEGAAPGDLSDVRSIQVWFSQGTFTLSSVRVRA